MITAMLAVASGLCRHVLCFRTVWESTFAALRLGPRGGGRVSGMQEFRAPFGAMSAANWIGMTANQYLHRYGATREMLGWVAVNGRANAARNPVAIYREPMTIDDYFAARPITSPFGLYDCDVPCDASIAVVVSDASVAADLPKPAIEDDEVLVQVKDPRLTAQLNDILESALDPATRCWELGPEGRQLAMVLLNLGRGRLGR